MQEEVNQKTVALSIRTTKLTGKVLAAALGKVARALQKPVSYTHLACTYEAAYSKGKPDRVGGRGDYETVTPNGMERIRLSLIHI